MALAVDLKQRNIAVKELLNGTHIAIKTVVPLSHQLSKPSLGGKELALNFGVLIGITGDVKGKLVLSGDLDVFQGIGEMMYGMALEGDMLTSFSGELGNMLAGRIATTISDKGINIDITSPTIIQGDTHLTGHKQALKLTVTYEALGDIDVFLLID